VVAKFVALDVLLDERARRLWAAAESRAIGFGGDALVSSAKARSAGWPVWFFFPAPSGLTAPAQR
jgi:hypothetical protein